MRNTELEKLINHKLNSNAMEDYAPNGLQVEGRQEVKRIVTGVTACQALLDSALAHRADAVIVHHGYFWKYESLVIKGIQRRRLKTLLTNDINLYAWHLPLDVHAELGNNAQLAAALNIQITGAIEPLLLYGELQTPLSGKALRLRIEQALKCNVLHCGDNGPKKVKRVSWCSGSGQKFIDAAVQMGIDAFITGEAFEQTIHYAREEGLHFYAAGHHATERGGVRALGKWLAQQHNFDVIFVDIPNPV